MKTNKIISAVLAGAMLFSSAYSLAFAEGDEVVYTYTNEDGETVNITQSQLDAEHWNKDALGDEIPAIYEDFPMSIDSYINDFAQLSLDIEYMKEIEDMDSVTFRITDMQSGTDVCNMQLTNYSIYSPALETGKNYEICLTEVLDGVVSEYMKGVTVSKVTSDINSVANFNNIADERNILIADTDVLRNGMTVNEQGQLVVDASVAKYDKVSVNDFYDYIDALPENKTYRLYMNDSGEQYSGFISTDDQREIYTLEVNSFNIIMPFEDTSLITQCDAITNVSALSNVNNLDLTDSFFRINSPSSLNAAYKAYKLSVPQTAIENWVTNGDDAQFRAKVTGNSQIRVKYWVSFNGTVQSTTTRTSTSNNIISFTYTLSNYDYIGNNSDYVDLYFMVYFPQTVSGTGMINFSGMDGYVDDVTGSVYEAYIGSSPISLSNTEYNLTDSWDVDAFHIETENTGVYKIEFRNRSLAAQTQMESGTWVNGEPEKTITGWSVVTSNGVVTWSDYAVYSLQKNQDIILYKQGNEAPNVLTIRNKSLGYYDAKPYQISYTFIPQ
ncbi:MAG: hypothetical protein PUF72_11520 [Clostridiales bacterium]|nr:hypothetical protein [Clostridiales bacterium]